LSEPALAPASPHHSLPWTKWEALALDSGYLDGVDNSAAPSHPRIADALTPELSKTFLCRRKAKAGNCVRQSSHPALSRIPQHKSLAPFLHQRPDRCVIKTRHESHG